MTNPPTLTLHLAKLGWKMGVPWSPVFCSVLLASEPLSAAVAPSPVRHGQGHLDGKSSVLQGQREARSVLTSDLSFLTGDGDWEREAPSSEAQQLSVSCL